MHTAFFFQVLQMPSAHLEEQDVKIGAYPTEAQVVEFAVWMSMHCQRACLAQRPEAGAKLTGLGKRNIRNT